MIKYIYVSPLGADSNTGSKESPLKSIQKAVDRAAEMNCGYWNGEVTVCLMEGVHELKAPVKVTGDVQIRITSAPGEKAVVSGGRALDGVCESEMAAVLRGDIPYFFCYGDDRCLRDASGVAAEDYFALSPLA